MVHPISGALDDDLLERKLLRIREDHPRGSEAEGRERGAGEPEGAPEDRARRRAPLAATAHFTIASRAQITRLVRRTDRSHRFAHAAGLIATSRSLPRAPLPEP